MKKLTAALMAATLCLTMCACEKKNEESELPAVGEKVESHKVEALPDGSTQYTIANYQFTISKEMVYQGGDEFRCAFERKLDSGNIVFFISEYPETLTTAKVYGEMLLPTYLNSDTFTDIKSEPITYDEREGFRITGISHEEEGDYDFECLMVADGSGSIFSLGCYYPQDEAKYAEYTKERDLVMSTLEYVGVAAQDAGVMEGENFKLSYPTEWFDGGMGLMTLYLEHADSACKRITSLAVEEMTDVSVSPKEFAESYRKEMEGSYRFYEDMDVFEGEILGRKGWVVSYGNFNDSCGHATLCYRYYFEEKGNVYCVTLGFCPEEKQYVMDSVKKMKLEV